MVRVAHAACIFFAAPALLCAEGIRLGIPIDCDLGNDCYIQQYVDRDPGPAAIDHRCGPLTYDTHRGTDFALITTRQMRDGVNVIAAAPGRVRAIRDGMDDIRYTAERQAEVAGKECGNGVVIEHADGWTTQYCHLRRNSVSVRAGMEIRRGDVLGQVGLSGRTQFPHVHLTVRNNDTVTDPFDPDAEANCNAPSSRTLWLEPPDYVAGGLIDAGFSHAVPTYDDIKAGNGAKRLVADMPALVFYVYAFGGRAGDRIDLRISGPNGDVAHTTVELDKNQALFFRAVGKRLTQDRWPSGDYIGRASLVRGGQIIDQRDLKATLQ